MNSMIIAMLINNFALTYQDVYFTWNNELKKDK